MVPPRFFRPQKTGYTRRSLRLELLENRQLLTVMAGFSAQASEAWIADEMITVAQTPMSTAEATVLDTPTGLTAASVKKDSISISWNAVENAGSYEVQYKLNTESAWTKCGETSDGATSYSVNNLIPDTTYDIRVMALPVSGSVDYSASEYANLTQMTMNALSTPTILAAGTYAESSTAIYVTWEGDWAAYNYSVEYQVSGTEAWTNISTDGNNTSTRIPGLLSGTTYDIQVTAKANPDGTSDYADSDPSDIYSVKTFIKLDAPTNITVTEVADHSISFSWESVANADGYTVSCYRMDSPEELITTDIQDTAYTFSGLDSNTNYTIWVYATNSDTTAYEQSDPSDRLELKTLKTTLTAPENLRSTARDLDSVTLDWNKVEEIDYYLIEYKDKSSFDWQQQTTNMTGITIDSLTSGREYEFRVFSIADPEGDFIDSAPSGSVTVKTLAKIDTPWDFEVYDKSNNYVALQWAQITSPPNTSYEVVYYPTDDSSQAAKQGVDDCYAEITGLDSNTSYTFIVKAVSSDSDYVDSDFCTPIAQTTDYEIRLSPDFTPTVAYNQTAVLGEIFIDDFLNPEDATLTFTVDGTPNTDNFSAAWDEQQNGFVVSFNNDNEAFVPIKYEVRITATEDGKTASSEFSFTVTTNVNGLEVSGIQDTDWVWDETAKNLRVMGDIVVTGAAASDMTISMEKDASVSDDEVGYMGFSNNDAPGTLAIIEGEGLTNDPNVTAGVLFDGSSCYVASNASFSVGETTFTNTSDSSEKLQFGTDGVSFLTGEWNVDVPEGKIMTVAAVANGVSVDFGANDKFAFSVVTYTVGDNGGGFRWNDVEYRRNTYGITYATTGNSYSGVTLTSTSSNAFGADASNSLEYLSYNFIIFDGDWTATRNDETKMNVNLEAILQNGSLTGTLKNGQQKTFAYSDATVDEVKASSVTIDFDHTDAKIKTIKTGYEVSGFLYSCESAEQIITCSAIDLTAKKIRMNQGVWKVEILTSNTVGSTVFTTISDSATLLGTENDAVYSVPNGALDSTFEVVEVDVEVEGRPDECHTRIQNGVDDYLLGSVVISADHGKYTAPVIDNDLQTMTITDGDWYVSDFLTGMVGGTVVLQGGTFTDADGDSVIFHGQKTPLTINGTGLLELDTLVTVDTAQDVVDLYDGVTSLREAISYAKASAVWGNVITFSDTIDWRDAANTITLDAANGSLAIDHTLTIDGGTQNVTINGNHVGTVFTIEDKAGTAELPVEMKGLKITGGTGTSINDDLYGGAILNYGVVTVEYSAFKYNYAAYGGAVANFNQFTIFDSTLVNNSSPNDGGAFYNEGTDAKMTIANSTVAENTAVHGGGVYNNGGALLLVNSIVVGNSGNHDVVLDNGGSNYANYSILGSVKNETTDKVNAAAFDGDASGVYGSSFSKEYVDIFGENEFDGRTIRIEWDSIAAGSGTLVGSIGQTIYYYNRDYGYWWNATTNTKSEYAFDAEDTTAYGLTGGFILAEGQNLNDEGNRVSRVSITDNFDMGALLSKEYRIRLRPS